MKTLLLLLALSSHTLSQTFFPYSPPPENYWPQGLHLYTPSFYFDYTVTNSSPNNTHTPNKLWLRAFVVYNDLYFLNQGHIGGAGGEMWAWVDPDTELHPIPIKQRVMELSDLHLDAQLLSQGHQLLPVTPEPTTIYSWFTWFPTPILSANIIHRNPIAGGAAFGVEITYWVHVRVCFGITEIPQELAENGFDLHVIANLDSPLDGSGWMYRRVQADM